MIDEPSIQQKAVFDECFDADWMNLEITRRAGKPHISI